MVAANLLSPEPGVRPLYWIDRRGVLKLRLHAGQMRAYQSGARVVLVLAGTQSGKTSFGPFWLAREIQRRGPGDYLVVAPTFKLLSLKLFPEFLRLFKTACRWGDFTGRGSFQSRFVLNTHGQRSLFGKAHPQPTQVFFCHAQDPDSVESATAKAAWLDEAGQKKFRLGTWEAVQRRLAIHQGRTLITTTPYTLGWLKDQLHDPWHRARALGQTHPYVQVVNFRSVDNPAFPAAEDARAKATLPAWKYKMMFHGVFEKPAGAIYSDFDPAKHVIPPFPVPPTWPRYLGLDFGGVHTAGVFLAAEVKADGTESGRYFLYAEYPPAAHWQTLSAAQHVKALSALLPAHCQGPEDYYRDERVKAEAAGETSFAIPPVNWALKVKKAVGGSHSEGQWRLEFQSARDKEGKPAGMVVAEPPVKEVEVGIDRVVSAIKQDRLYVFNTCTAALDDLQSYARVLDDAGNPTEEIEDKEDYHYCDALRYVMAYLMGGRKEFWMR